MASGSGALGLHLNFNRLPAVQSALRAAALQALHDRAEEATTVIRAYEHVITGYMRAHTTATVAVMRNDEATSSVQSTAPYSRDEEEGTRYRPGHHRIAAGAAAYQRLYAPRMAAALGAAAEGAAR